MGIFISVICPIYNEEKYIAKCIDSIIGQDYPKEDMEVLFVDGMSMDKTRSIVQEYSKKYSFIHLLENPMRIAPCAMNVGIKASKGEVIIRLDAHASYCSDYFSVLSKRLLELNADNVGVVCKTDVLNKNPKTLAIREVLSNKFGVGNSAFRTGVTEVKEVDTVPFGCWKREAFDKYGLYDERLIRNQDFELNRRIIQGGGKIYLLPDTYCTYYARETYKKLWMQNYNNGLWGIRTVLFTGRADSLALRHYIPMIFVLSLMVTLLAAMAWIPLALISLLSALAYIFVLGTISLKIALEKRLNAVYLFVGFATLHVSNGLGMLVSLFTAKCYVRKMNQSRNKSRVSTLIKS